MQDKGAGEDESNFMLKIFCYGLILTLLFTVAVNGQLFDPRHKLVEARLDAGKKDVVVKLDHIHFVVSQADGDFSHEAYFLFELLEPFLHANDAGIGIYGNELKQVCLFGTDEHLKVIQQLIRALDRAKPTLSDLADRSVGVDSQIISSEMVLKRRSYVFEVSICIDGYDPRAPSKDDLRFSRIVTLLLSTRGVVDYDAETKILKITDAVDRVNLISDLASILDQ